MNPDIRLAHPGEATCQMVMDATGRLCGEPAAVVVDYSAGFVVEDGDTTSYCAECWDRYLQRGDPSVEELRRGAP